jgi:hypothetical protein
MVYFTAFWYMLWPLVIFYFIINNYMVNCFPFWYVVSRKIWQPCIHEDNFSESNFLYFSSNEIGFQKKDWKETGNRKIRNFRINLKSRLQSGKLKTGLK